MSILCIRYWGFIANFTETNQYHIKQMKIFKSIFVSVALVPGFGLAQDYAVTVSESNEPMMTGKYAPTWE